MFSGQKEGERSCAAAAGWKRFGGMEENPMSLDPHGGNIYAYDGVKLDFSVNLNPLGMPEEILRAVGTMGWSMTGIRTPIAGLCAGPWRPGGRAGGVAGLWQWGSGSHCAPGHGGEAPAGPSPPPTFFGI